MDRDIDKGKVMDSKDKQVYKEWEKFITQNFIEDAYRIKCPSKKSYSFVESQGKSRGDRLYINEEYLNKITNFRYVMSPFKTAHKIMTFDVSGTLSIGPGYWKMNSSILTDEAYKASIGEIIQGLNNDPEINNPIDWWDLFIMVVRGVTID